MPSICVSELILADLLGRPTQEKFVFLQLSFKRAAEKVNHMVDSVSRLKLKGDRGEPIGTSGLSSDSGEKINSTSKVAFEVSLRRRGRKLERGRLEVKHKVFTCVLL